MKQMFCALITLLILNSTFPILNCPAIAAMVQLPATGQNKCYDPTGNTTNEIPCAGTGQDGAVRAGVASPNPRFQLSGACVTDNLTGLMWSQNANLFNGTRTWQRALDWVVTLNSGGGLCGYSDWRLPSRRDLYSLVDLQNSYPSLPTGHPFSNVVNDYYWSSSSYPYNTDRAWYVGMNDGVVNGNGKSNYYRVWPVRGGL